MKKDMSLEGLRWSCNSGSALYDTPPNGRSRTGWGGGKGLLPFQGVWGKTCETSVISKHTDEIIILQLTVH